MRVQYQCKYCKQFVGEVHRPDWSMSDAEAYLGFERLSPTERQDAIAYNGQEALVQTVCDYCQEALETHPELLVEGKLLQ